MVFELIGDVVLRALMFCVQLQDCKIISHVKSRVGLDHIDQLGLELGKCFAARLRFADSHQTEWYLAGR